jgi:peptidase M42 family hydrolase
MDTAKRITDMLVKLLNCPSPAGHCDAVAKLVSDMLSDAAWEVEQKSDGAVIGSLPGKDGTAHPLVFAAHIDTLGAQVKAIKPNGRLQLIPVGSWSSRFAEGARCIIHSDGALPSGTILPLKASGHAYGDEVDELPVSWANVELRIDADVYSQEDVEQLGVRVGDIVSINPQPEFLDNGYIVSRHLDDKAAVAVLLQVAKEIVVSGNPLGRPVKFVFSVSEEVGTGASQFATMEPADVIALDFGIVAPEQASTEKGIALCMGDAGGPYDRNLSRWVETTCHNSSIDCGRDVFRHYYSDATAMKRAGADARMALLTFGMDASHGYERTHIDSLIALKKAVHALIDAQPL